MNFVYIKADDVWLSDVKLLRLFTCIYSRPVTGPVGNYYSGKSFQNDLKATEKFISLSIMLFCYLLGMTTETYYNKSVCVCLYI